MNLREFYEQNQKLFHIHHSARYPGLRVVKYARSVFYNNLWNEYLVESRGLVVDSDWNVVVRPFTKVFNRGENGTDIGRDEHVTATYKINGFMAAATYVPSIDEVIVSTTGSLDSPFVTMAESFINKDIKDEIKKLSNLSPTTFLFEIVHDDDPHIIKEHLGAYLIGARSVIDDCPYMSDATLELSLDNIALRMGVRRPRWIFCRFSDIVRGAKLAKHEGFVVYSEKTALKIKSPYYLTTKFFARIGTDRLLKMTADQLKQSVDEEYYDLVDFVKSSDKFASMNEQERISMIEEFLDF